MQGDLNKKAETENRWINSEGRQQSAGRALKHWEWDSGALSWAVFLLAERISAQQTLPSGD